MVETFWLGNSELPQSVLVRKAPINTKTRHVPLFRDHSPLSAGDRLTLADRQGLSLNHHVSNVVWFDLTRRESPCVVAGRNRLVCNSSNGARSALGEEEQTIHILNPLKHDKRQDSVKLVFFY